MTPPTAMPACASRLCAVAVAAFLAAAPVAAQPDQQAAAWRATSRLGYGPTQASAQAAQQNPKSWAATGAAARNAATATAQRRLAQAGMAVGGVMLRSSFD